MYTMRTCREAGQMFWKIGFGIHSIGSSARAESRPAPAVAQVSNQGTHARLRLSACERQLITTPRSGLSWPSPKVDDGFVAVVS